MKKLFIIFMLLSISAWASNYVYIVNPDQSVSIATKGSGGTSVWLDLPLNVDVNKPIYLEGGILTNKKSIAIETKERIKTLRKLISVKESLLDTYKKKGWNSDKAELEAEIKALEDELNLLETKL